MHPSVQLGNQVRAALRIRTRIATEDLYELIGRPLPVTKPRFIVKPAGVAFFHVVDSRTGKACGFRRDHNEACALARRLEQQE
ncbi:hypothetical protein HX890_11950 [Pseudomonas gingeri]|uniref:hypothetical protein n=1 Tax=Pseudomonas gingeri TaxID=117681 RepID=UPI00159FF611|nr:hypothetical protein [Pseudomonas gingeri]NWD74818.1 hypothetical protein [Pseudomonas gingeri]